MSASETAEGPAAAGPSDAVLISRVRAGDRAAYGLLRERHVAAARLLARHLMAGTDRPGHAADEVVGETFATILDVLRRGGGPRAGFRPYLIVALRRTAGARASGERTRRERRPPVTPAAVPDPDPYADPVLRGAATNMIARAFLSLPERWRAVLWHSEIEGARPAAVAPLLGLTPNGVAALDYAAREGLRQAYLQLYLAESARRACRPALDKLPAYLRGGLAARDTVVVERHLSGCRDCAAIYTELADVKAVLRAIVGPLLLGAAAAGYLADIAADSGGGLRRLWRHLPKRPRRRRGGRGANTTVTRQ
ncbi:MAG TPA: sigma-70 family RNA polymerase sigma factor [Streptosporangiaceae bacterium]|nr:sigma-70 family RNA polymerase sigma factor [Streptosporangiaceae bacterium]